MNPLTKWYDAYRAWEDRYIALFDALNAGREVAPSWMRTAHGRRMVRKSQCMSVSERRQMRDFIWRCRGWRGWASIAILITVDCLIGVVVHFASNGKFGLVEGAFLVNAVVIGIGMGVVGVWFNPGQFSRLRGRGLVILPILAIGGAVVGAGVAALVNGESPADVFARAGKNTVFAGLGVGIALTVLLTLIVSLRNRELKAANAQLAAESNQQRLGNEVTAARLRLLQAQIEPHFLFNTLGAVQQLAEGRAPEAATLTAHLIRFLRNSVGSFSDRTTTIGDELAVVDSYLRIMQSRLADRLAFSIEVPDALRACLIQPTMLLNFVENAIKHGIERSLRGGEIRISASSSTGLVTIEVADNGPGMADVVGDGHGLRNAREQLALAYDTRARLDLIENEPTGLIVRLTIPCETVPTTDAP